MNLWRAGNRFPLAHKGRRATPRYRRLRFEQLEDRRVLAPLVVSPYDVANPASLLTSALVTEGTGLTVDSATFAGASGQAGTYSGLNFSSGVTALNVSNGVILTTGDAVDATSNSSSNVTSDLSGSGDPDLGAFVGASTNDAAALTIHFTASSETKFIQFEFVFSSEEFPEFVGSSFNDVFAAFLDGKQICFDPQGRSFSVNNNFFLLNNSGNSSDPDTVGKVPVTFTLAYDGLTRRLVTKAALDGSIAVHELKLVIGDVGDSDVDSAVFLANLQGKTTGVDGTEEVVETNGLPTIEAPTIERPQEPVVEPPNNVIVEAAEPVIRFRLIDRVPAAELAIGDAGSGGQLIGIQGPTGTPQGGAPPRDMVMDALAEGSSPTPTEIVDAVYSLADIELVTLVGYDMGDEPMARKRPAKDDVGEKPSETAAIQQQTLKPFVDEQPVSDERDWRSLALWSAWPAAGRFGLEARGGGEAIGGKGSSAARSRGR